MVKSVEGIYRNGKVEAEPVDLRERGIDESQAADLRRRLAQPSQLEGFAGAKPFRISEGYPKVFTTGKGVGDLF